VARERFTVYIVESPSSKDLYEGRGEGVMLLRALELAGIPSFHKMAVNRELLRDALTKGFIDAVKAGGLRPPVLHLSAHGFEDGIGLTSGEVVQWWDLGGLLGVLNDTVHGQLMVSMSSCKGLHGTKMVCSKGNLPFLALIGSQGEPTWPETAIGFAAFYHNLAESGDLDESIDAMRAASRHCGFEWLGGQHARDEYNRIIERLKTEHEATSPPPNHPPAA